jgi:hypothetical protein
VRERDASRQRTTGKVAYRQGGVTIEQLDEYLGTIPKFGLWLDTSTQTPQETVEEILRRHSEASVDGVF